MRWMCSRWDGGLRLLALSVLCAGGFNASAEDLEREGLAVYEDRQGYALAVTEYEMKTEADLASGKPAEHELSLAALVRADEDEDVLCVNTKLVATSALGDRRRELLVPERRRSATKFAALLPSKQYRDRRRRPLMLAEVELSAIELDRPAYEVKSLVVELSAVVVADRDDAEVAAIVADRFVDLGRGVAAKVTGMKVDRGEMTVTMKLRRPAGTRSPVLDSVVALDRDGDEIGGGRWVNELDLFANECDVQLSFALEGKQSVDRLRVVLATDYEVKRVPIEIEGLFQK